MHNQRRRAGYKTHTKTNGSEHSRNKDYSTGNARTNKNDPKSSKRIVVILGPTASGKTALAIVLAKKLNGEIVSADSRQVYKGLDIGTGKVTKKEMSGIPHHMLDIASAKSLYTVDHYKKDAEKAVDKILKKGKLPIICGGTGFYIDALVYNQKFPDVKINKKLREKYSKKSAETLFKILLKKDPVRAASIDKHNTVRLLRALEIVEALGKVPVLNSNTNSDTNLKGEKELSSVSMRKYDSITIGIKTNPKILQEKINSRLLSRIKSGMIKEVGKLHKNGLSWKRMEMLGLEYRYVSRYLQGLISKETMIKELNIAIWQYAKRQMTWFKRNKEIRWLDANKAVSVVIRDFF